MSTVALPVPVRAQPGYFQKQSPAYLILGSFLLMTLPLTLLALWHREVLDQWHVGLLYIIGLGTTHFILTFTVYLQSSNLRYFNSSWVNRTLYFLIPVAIFLFFDLYRTLQVAIYLPLFDVGIFLAIRLFDFQHFGRQSYGVFQLFKGRSQCPFPAWTRKVESLYFFGLTGLLMLTFLYGGHFDGTRVETIVLLSIVLGLLSVILLAFAIAWRHSTRRSAVLAPLAYFCLQSAAAALAIHSSSLYLVCLATHYVEYHVLMVPRCFHVALDTQTRTDWLFERLRRNKIIFYLVLLGLAAIVTSLTWQVMGMMIARTDPSPTNSYLFLIALFDGLFVFHYFIESFIWKFSDPHYRKTLGPLYFAPKALRPTPAIQASVSAS